MKVIFLDIDGVLNYIGSAILDNSCLNELKRICRETKAKLVLISTWRVFLENTFFENNFYRKLMLDVFTKENGIPIYDIVSNLNDNRSLEIDIYLKSHNISSFVILDDCDYEYSKNYKNNWVQTWWYKKGLCPKDADNAIEILNYV